LIFLPVRDKAAEPQSVSVAINASAPFSRVTRIVADGLTARVQRALVGCARSRNPLRPRPVNGIALCYGGSVKARH
jgi:hypothetical protein